MSEGSETQRVDERGVICKCLFFALYAELLGCTEMTICLSSGSTVADAVDHVRENVEAGFRLPKEPLVARNRHHVKHDCVLDDGDELAFLPPLAGG